VLLGLVEGVGVGLGDGLDVGLADGDACALGLVLARVLGDELSFPDDPEDGLPGECECPAEAGAPPALPVAGVVPCLPPDLAEPPPADLPGVGPAPPDVLGGEEFSACVVCVWE
jgi:hypothetical protein